jgi:ferredoxin
MCEFCIKHGEGKKWYEVMENYSQELLHQGNREAYIKDLFAQIPKNYYLLEKMQYYKRNLPRAYKLVSRIGSWKMKHDHFGQVVPIEDAEIIVDMVQSITRIPCVCREATTGNKNARYCLVLGIDPLKILGDYPDLKAKLETYTAEEAKLLLRKFDEEGLIHSVWTFKTPFIGAICNCDYDCLAYRFQVSKELIKLMFKAEYIADIEPQLCIGCRNCQKVCQFGAIEYSSLAKKCTINLQKCYGCGVCRKPCHKEAISLMERDKIPHLSDVW